ncbi:Transcriptional activator protein lasR [Leminorella richardii]|uniref:Transcriptional activator protein lasR n=1 Tax=Leminorella richardii TaxID=158841 RepID=A0A2X4V058_9GAMM|nr:LuxR family transcriptional regulator [Leminorella richardii]SQI40232.1 Transcriptional activator protein lasR [Leminorella richardii]
MKINLYKTYESLSKSKNKDTFFATLQKAAKNLGFEYCAYGVRSTYPVSSSKTHVINNYPDDWNLKYQLNNYFEIDPTVHHGLRSTQAFIWEESIHQESSFFWEEAKSFGINYGMSQAQKDAQGRIGMLSFASANNNLDDKSLIVHAPSLIWLSQIAHARLSEYLIPQEGTEADFQLTKREKDILRWTAEGKTSNEIAIVMSISDRTVNFHINNIIKKLSVSNKTAAAVKALVLNLF